MNINLLYLLVITIFLFVHHSIGTELDGAIVYNINWPGVLPKNLDVEKHESMILTSSMQEKYQCYLPNVIETEEEKDEVYNGPTPIELIMPLFNEGLCSYRMESYWTYEICHGRYVRQYNEEREGKKVKIQEYKLGRWDEKNMERLVEISRQNRVDLDPNTPVLTKKIDNMNLPYYEMEMNNGTLCDLNNNKPRITRILYVCYIHGKHEVYSLKEVSTCVYEVIILCPFLCKHPRYKPKENSEHKINCVPLDGVTNEPYNLLKMGKESAKLKKLSELDRLKVELIQFKAEDAIDLLSGNKLLPQFVNEKNYESVSDSNPVKAFLEGEQCLYGGTGWWKFEFCYGKSVEQFHIEKDGKKISINLGNFNKEKHLAWLNDHPNKRPVAEKHQISHFYSDGDVCDKTGQPRRTEVKLRCLANPKALTSASLYLLEPKYCEYILGVESPLICDIMDKVDKDGLVEIPPENDKDKFTIKVKIN